MGLKRKKIEYDLEDSDDLFVAPTWPDAFLRDPAYALLRPLYERTSPWRSSSILLHQYLTSQARRLGNRRHLAFHFSNLAKVSSEYDELCAFFLTPFDKHSQLQSIFSQMEEFLRHRFETYPEKPWADFPVEQLVMPKGHISNKDIEAVPTELTEQDRKKLLKKELAKIPWQQQLQQALEHGSGTAGFHASLVEKAIKECPSLLTQKRNEDLVNQIFASPATELSLTMGEDGYLVATIPVMIGSHYLGRKTQQTWFTARGKKFYRILGCYARWDDANVLIFRHDIHDDTTLQKQMFASIKTQKSLVSVGSWKKAQVDGVDYYLSILVDADLPEKSFVVSEWELNCPQLIIVTSKGY